MGIFDLFKTGGSGPALSDHWKHPESEDDIRGLFSPDAGTQLIYKHSFACSICTYSLMSIEKKADEISSGTGMHFIDVRASRPLSNLTAELSGVTHESPQAILLHNGEVFWHGSHAEVRAERVLDAISEI
jgi:bacillithiol system protein YtxJ